jgi:hypothetical protein
MPYSDVLYIHHPAAWLNYSKHEGLDGLCSLQVRLGRPVLLLIEPVKSTNTSRSRRRKCELQRGTNTCTYCSERGITCIRKEPSYGSTSPGSGPDSSVVVHRPIENGLELPPPALCMELVELYFDLIHNQFHALFHPPSFIEDVRQGVAPRTILFAMMALSARYLVFRPLYIVSTYHSDLLDFLQIRPFRV